MSLRKAGISDVSLLEALCSETYTKAFANHWTGDGLTHYLEQEFNQKRLRSELSGTTYEYHIIQKDAKNVGFLKLCYATSVQLSRVENCELLKIYILPGYSGMGIGKSALTTVIGEAIRKGKEQLFLSVIDTNRNAIDFYKRLGFTLHSKTRLEVPDFREELRGMHRMVLQLRRKRRTTFRSYFTLSNGHKTKAFSSTTTSI